MRCLSLAERIRDFGGDVCFVVRQDEGNLVNFITELDFKVVELLNLDISGLSNTELQEQDAVQTIAIIKETQNLDWIIVDHYDFDQLWEGKVKPYVNRIMVIDDLANRYHSCDLLLDQNWLSDMKSRKSQYEKLAVNSELLLGPEFSLLRDEFSQVRKLFRLRDGVIKRVLIFFGGGDPGNFTGKVLSVLMDLEFKSLILDVVLGEMNPNISEIIKQTDGRANIYIHIQTDKMVQLISESDLCLGAGGSVTWERMCLGLPSIVWTLADNQRSFTKDLHNAGLLTWMGDSDHFSAKKLKKEMRNALSSYEVNKNNSERCMELVDGLGATRVYHKLVELLV